MERLFRLRYPIRRMRLVDHYRADDDRSMAADNTSAFNCRPVAGTSRWSEHGRSVNPVQNRSSCISVSRR
jgi:poly-gamma-glutamate synthesis protein (capsule biosynthesis protein)